MPDKKDEAPKELTDGQKALDSINTFIEEYRKNVKEDRRQAKIDRYHNVMWWSWSFALATIALAVASPQLYAKVVSAVEAVIFVVIGVVYNIRSRLVK